MTRDIRLKFKDPAIPVCWEKAKRRLAVAKDRYITNDDLMREFYKARPDLVDPLLDGVRRR